MSKALKRLLVMLIVLIATILILPKLEHAVLIDLGGKSTFYPHQPGTWIHTTVWYDTEVRKIEYGNNNIKYISNGDDFYLDGRDIFKNPEVFCLSKQDNYNWDDPGCMTYRVKMTYKFNSIQATPEKYSGESFLNGLAYILSYVNVDKRDLHKKVRNPPVNEYTYVPGSDDAQLALWAYIDTIYDVERYNWKSWDSQFKDLLRDQGSSEGYHYLIIDSTNKEIRAHTGPDEYIYNHQTSKTAYEYYQNALNIYRGTKAFPCDAKFYYWESNGLYLDNLCQDLLVCEHVTPESTLTITVKKVDPEENPVIIDQDYWNNIFAGSFKVVDANNVTGGFTLDTSGYLNEGKKSYSGIKLEDKSKEGSITLEESIAPTGYEKLTEQIKIYINYNSKTNKYECTLDENLDGGGMASLSTTSGTTDLTLKVKNNLEQTGLNITLEKVDSEENLIKKYEGSFYANAKEYINVAVDGNEINENIGWTLKNGIININNIKLKDTTKEGYLILHELTAPTGYEKLPDNINKIKIKITYDSSTKKYTCTLEEDAGGMAKIDTSLDTTELKLTVKNNKEGFKLNLKKVDSENNKEQLERSKIYGNCN